MASWFRFASASQPTFGPQFAPILLSSSQFPAGRIRGSHRRALPQIGSPSQKLPSQSLCPELLLGSADSCSVTCGHFVLSRDNFASSSQFA